MHAGKCLSSSLLFMLFLGFSANISAQHIERIYKWRYEQKTYTFIHKFTQADYNYYKKQKRNYNDFSVYLLEHTSYKVINQIAYNLKGIASKNNLTEKQTIDLIIAFVQQLRYIDDGYYEYPKYPIETLVDGGGDCEDSAILLAAILKSMQYNCVLLSPKGHMGVGIAVKENLNGTSVTWNNTQYYYIETTNTGWGIGDYPDHLSAQIIVYDAGVQSTDKALSIKNSTTTASSNTHNNAQNYSATSSKEESSANTADTYTPLYNYTSNQSMAHKDASVLSVDKVVIDGNTEVMVTQVADQNGKSKVVANAK